MNDLEHARNLLTLAYHDLTALKGMRDADRVNGIIARIEGVAGEQRP